MNVLIRAAIPGDYNAVCALYAQRGTCAFPGSSSILSTR
jgi:hypothetical protein